MMVPTCFANLNLQSKVTTSGLADYDLQRMNGGMRKHYHRLVGVNNDVGVMCSVLYSVQNVFQGRAVSGCVVNREA